MQADFAPPADQGPHHLAQTVLRALSVSMPEPPPEDLLFYFFSALYEAGFRVDQGAPLRGRVIWQSHAGNLDDAPEQLRLTPPVPFSAGSLALLLNGTKPPSALLVSEGETYPLVFHGIAPGQAEPLAPSVFHADILGPAHLRVEVGLDYSLELRRNRLHLSTQNVFGRGPVRARLGSLLETLYPAVLNLLPAEITGSPLLAAESFPLPGGGVLLQEQQDWPETLAQLWINALVLLLRQIGETQRGGLVLLTSRRDRTALEEFRLAPPHGGVYAQLRRLLERRATAAIVRQTEAAESLTAALGQNPAPDDLLLQEPGLAADVLTHDTEITRAAQFLASLACGDGPLCLTPQLELLSFGGQPGLQALPERVYLAADETAAELTPISSRSFGPRNQALLSLCHQDPSSVGFAFTQDGDLRAMLRHEDKLIVWNAVNLPRR